MSGKKLESTGRESIGKSDKVPLPQVAVSKSRYNLRNLGPPRIVAYSEVECPICLDLFVQPVIANCGHSFCTKCVLLCMKKSRSCPVCKKVLLKTLFLSSVEYTQRLRVDSKSRDQRKTLATNKVLPTGGSSTTAPPSHGSKGPRKPIRNRARSLH